MFIQSVLSDFASGLVGKALNLGGQLAFPQEGALSALREHLNNAKNPVGLPPPDALLAAMLQGWFEFDANGKPIQGGMDFFNRAMRYAGIAMGEKGYDPRFMQIIGQYQGMWNAIIESKANRPGIHEAFMAYISGAADLNKFELMLRRNGCYIDDWKWLVPFYSQRLTIDQAQDAWHRGLMTEAEFDSYARMLQYGIPGDIQKLKDMSMLIPGPNDMIRLVVRDTFNPRLVAALELDKELDENTAYLEWAKAVGLGEVTIKDSKGQPLTADFAKQAWYAHWDLPSPGMGYEFYHRFYDASRYGPSPWLNQAPKFLIDDLQDLLKANDYSPRYRKQLAAVSLHPLTRVDTRRLHADGIIGDADVYHNFRAGGYADKEADQMTRWIKKKTKDAQLKPEKDAVKKRSCTAYQQGTIDSDRMTAILIAAEYTKEEAALQVRICDVDLGINIAKDSIGSIKAGFMSGVYTEQEARIELQQIGIIDDRIKQYLYQWRLKMASRRKVVAAKEVANWFIDDIVSLEEFISRLTKLDYNAADVTRIVQSTILDKARRIAKAEKQSYLEMQRQIEKNLRETEKRRKEAERLARQREAELRRIQNEALAAEKNRLQQFLALRTEGNLRKWLANGEITELEIRETFRIKGMNDADITRWLDTERGNR